MLFKVNVAFPELGWDFSMDSVAFSIGSFTANWYGVLICLGFVLALLYGGYMRKYFDASMDDLLDIGIICFPSAIVGARLYYILFSSERAVYFEEPFRILEIWEGGLAIYGGLIFACAAGLIVLKVKKKHPAPFFDLASIGFLIGQSVGRWGNFVNGECHGYTTDLPWGMVIQKEGELAGPPVHPTFLYESLWCLAGLFVLHFMAKKRKFNWQIFLTYVMWYGAGRFIIEGMRTDSLYIFGRLRVSQLLAGISFLTALILFILLWRKSKQKKEDELEYAPVFNIDPRTLDGDALLPEDSAGDTAAPDGTDGDAGEEAHTVKKEEDTE